MKILNSLIRFKISSISILFFIQIAIQSNISAQGIDFCGELPFNQATSTNLDSIYYDRFGNSYDLGHFSYSENDPERVGEVCGYFRLDYFDVPNNLRPIICEVFEYMSELVQQRTNTGICEAIVNPDTVNIKITYDTIKYSGTNTPNIFTAASASPMYTGAKATCDEVALTSLYSKINGGFKSLPSLNPDRDGLIMINKAFLAPFYLGSGTTPNGYVDFFSIILHEVGHLYGFTSNIDTLGPINGYYSLWDQNIHVTTYYDGANGSSNLEPLIVSDCDSNCWTLNSGYFNTLHDLDSILSDNCNIAGNLDFVFGKEDYTPLAGGALGVNSLSHLSYNCNSESIRYVMGRSIDTIAPNNQNREFSELLLVI